MGTCNISVERLYSLGQYQSLRVSVGLNEVPAELLTDSTYRKEVENLLHGVCEVLFIDYARLRKDLNDKDIEDAVKFLEEKINNASEILNGKLSINVEV